ncbi:hypothetical protein BGY98DRAFT_1178224, partial [Russula aff. rugulosa BPL654]
METRHAASEKWGGIVNPRMQHSCLSSTFEETENDEYLATGPYVHDPGNIYYATRPCRVAPSELFPLSRLSVTITYELPIVLSYTNCLLPFMSNVHPTASSSHNQASNFQLIINNALDLYKKRTRNDLLAHPLVTALQSCNSPSTILAVLQQQLQGLDQSRRSDERWMRWLDPTVNVLYTLSGTLGEGFGLVFSPAKVIFAGVGVLLSAAKDVRASQDTLVDVFERIEMFFRRLETYTQV